MVTKRILSEYMKKFRDPRWETYTKCYEEMLAYRLGRRLLEHTHNPWFWSGSDSESGSGGRSPPHPSKNQVGPGRAEDGTVEAEGVTVDRRQDQETRSMGAGPGKTTQEEEQLRPDPQPSAHSLQQNETRESNKAHLGEEEEQKDATRASKKVSAPLRDQEKETRGPRVQQRKLSKSARAAWRSQRVRPAPSRQLKDDGRHPFALYGSGEKDANIADKKTHNVGPAASTAMIHESALRAKTRWQVERQIQSQRTEPRRAKSADPNKAGRMVPPEFNPWLTEYMRCFSARSR